MLDKLKDKIVFFDFDGVLCTYQFSHDKVHMPEESYIRHQVAGFFKNVPLYKYSRAPITMQNITGQLDSDNIYILTAVETIFEYWNKIEFVSKYYPNIRRDHILFSSRSESKLPLLESLYAELYKYRDKADLVLVEDTLSTIHSVESAGFTCYHISSFLE